MDSAGKYRCGGNFSQAVLDFDRLAYRMGHAGYSDHSGVFAQGEQIIPPESGVIGFQIGHQHDHCFNAALPQTGRKCSHPHADSAFVSGYQYNFQILAFLSSDKILVLLT
jgi:hypothetical protein